MHLTLDPASGHPELVEEVKFGIEFQWCDEARLEFRNASTGQGLPIIATTTGVIESDYILKLRRTSRAQGFIRLFPGESSKVVEAAMAVGVECSLVGTAHGETIRESTTTYFYNESHALDGDVVPFEVYCDSQVIATAASTGIRLRIGCNTMRRFELAIRDESGQHACHFEVFVKPPLTEVSLPAALLWHDLDGERNHNKTFYVYWVQFRAVHDSRVMRRRYVRVPGIILRFDGKELPPKATGRMGPCSVLSPDFVLSDRYLVHTWKDFTALSGRRQWDKLRGRRLSVFMHESQDIRKMTAAMGRNPSAISAEVRKKVLASNLPKVTRTLSAHHRASSLTRKRGCGCSKRATRSPAKAR